MYNFIDHTQLKNSLQVKPPLLKDSVPTDSKKITNKIPPQVPLKSRQKLQSSLISDQITDSLPADLIKNLTDLRVGQLKIIAQQYGISTTAPKDYLCKRIRNYLLSHPNPKKIKAKTLTRPLAHKNSKYHQTLQSLIKTPIDQFDLLLDLSNEKLKWIIGIIKLHQGSVDLKTVLTQIPRNREKVKVLISELIYKLCKNQKSIKELESKNHLTRREQIHLCINRILESQGIQMSKFISIDTKHVTPSIEPRKIIIDVSPPNSDNVAVPNKESYARTKFDSFTKPNSSIKEPSWATRVNSAVVASTEVQEPTSANQRKEAIKSNLENKIIVKSVPNNPLLVTKLHDLPPLFNSDNSIKVWRDNFMKRTQSCDRE
jgi:hypothetical protein